jgi:flavin-dependent dehydrogenase
MNFDIGNITIAYFGDYSSDYGYISGKNGIISAQLSGSLNLTQENLKKFINLVKETEEIELNSWSTIVSQFPKKVQLFLKYARKTFVLAGDIAGFLDPFFGFGINGALISGKIAATSILSKKKALQEFKKFTYNMNKNLLLHTIYWHLPFKNFIRSRIIKYQDMQIIPGKRSIPGFTDQDWLKII